LGLEYVENFSVPICEPAFKQAAGNLGASSGYRRIGSVAAALNLPVARELEPIPWKSLVELDPTADRRAGWVDKEWGVAWPYPSSELEAVTAT
jgi:hypothetical protein